MSFARTLSGFDPTFLTTLRGDRVFIEDPCFFDGKGARDGFSNWTFGEYPWSADHSGVALYTHGEACLGPWLGRVCGWQHQQDDFSSLANFSSYTTSFTKAAGGAGTNLDNTWVGSWALDYLGNLGYSETWTSLSDGTLPASWTPSPDNLTGHETATGLGTVYASVTEQSVFSISAGGTARNNYTGEVGLEFVVGGSNIVVVSLGRLGYSGNSGSHTLKLVRKSDSVTVGSVSITASGATLVYGYLSSPVTLTAGASYYLMSTETNGGDQWRDYNGTSVANDGSVNTVKAAYGTPYANPGAPAPTNLCYVGLYMNRVG